MTVSLALRNSPQISAATRTRILKLAHDLGYTPDATLQALMDQVRLQKPHGFQALIGVLHMVPQSFAEKTPSYAGWMAGAAARGAALGYRLDHLWLADENMKPLTVQRMLATRSAQGLLLPCFANAPALPETLHFLLDQYPCATVGYPCAGQPPIPGATNDRHATGTALFAKAVQAGCRRIGVVLQDGCEPVGNGRFSSAIAIAIASVRASHGYLTVLPANANGGHPRAAFLAWLDTQQPDCIITSVPEVRAWLEEHSVRVPEQVSFLYWQVDRHTPTWSGMCQNEDATGAAALDLIVAQLHEGEKKRPPVHYQMMVASTWVAGKTLRGS